jgi:hypothetical protein
MFSASIFRRASNQPAIQIQRAHVKWRNPLMPAQRFGELQGFTFPASIFAGRRINLQFQTEEADGNLAEASCNISIDTNQGRC